MKNVEVKCKSCGATQAVECDDHGPMVDYCDRCEKPIYDQAYDQWIEDLIDNAC